MVSYEELFEASLCRQSDKWTKDTLSGLPTCKGVFLFADISGRPIQLLQSANLRRTVQAKLLHEEPTTSSRKTDLSFLTARIFYITCYNYFQLQLTYIRSAHAVFQKSANNWIQLPKPSFAAIETDAYLPFLHVSENPKTHPNRKVFGLFPTRKAAAAFCETLNTIFGLCRNPSLLKSGKEASCPYLQMETCPGPCLQKKERGAYLKAVEQACLTAAGNIQSTIENLHREMIQTAQLMQFERAALLKKHSQNLEKLTRNDFRWVRDLQDLCILCMDFDTKRKVAGKNKKYQLYKAWKITATSVHELGIFVPRTPEQTASFLTHTWTQGETVVYAENTTEHLATLSLFLFRSEPPGLWLAAGQSPPAGVFEKLSETFRLDANC